MPDRLYLFGLAVLGGLGIAGYAVTHPDATPGLLHPLGGTGSGRPAYPVTSRFGARLDPITGLPAGHSGIDFGTPIGTPVYAATDATVARIDRDPQGGNGLAVHLEGGGYRWSYLHLSKLPPYKVGDHVSRGASIGETGNTGRTTGPHLHFQITDLSTGIPVNPEALYGPGVLG